MLESLQRPLESKLYSTNELVDFHNRNKILSMPDTVRLYARIVGRANIYEEFLHLITFGLGLVVQ